MALLNVSEILFDPDLTDSFNVRRRQQTIDSHGRVVDVEKVFRNVIAVVTATSPSDLDRRADYEGMSRSISIVGKFQLRGETTGYQPDIVVWRGDNYLVKHVDPYPQFGEGFFQAECSSMDKTDHAFEQKAIGQYVFNQPQNSVYLGTL